MSSSYSSLDDPDWPDFLDLAQGTFTYYGDDKRAGHALEDTAREGKALLRECFDRVHPGNRAQTPPFFVFTKGNKGRNVALRGVAVPSIEGLPADDLVAVWKAAEGKRFQNYRAVFSILDIPAPRSWILDLQRGRPLTENAPEAWRRWAEAGHYSVIRSSPTIAHRTPAEQTAMPPIQVKIVNCVYDYFKGIHIFWSHVQLRSRE